VDKFTTVCSSILFRKFSLSGTARHDKKRIFPHTPCHHFCYLNADVNP
jgi:hypothetical protein